MKLTKELKEKIDKYFANITLFLLLSFERFLF